MESAGCELADWIAAGMLFTEAVAKWAGEEVLVRLTHREGRSALRPDEHSALMTWWDGTPAGYRRQGTLWTASERRVALVQAVCLPGRIDDEDAKDAILCREVPLGTALAPLGVTRIASRPRIIHTGDESLFSMESSGLLVRPDGIPVALAREVVYASFTRQEARR